MLDCAMAEINEIYSEVLVPSERWREAEALEPIHSREVLGQRAMIFENIPRNELVKFGELRCPSITDLFVAKMADPS